MLPLDGIKVVAIEQAVAAPFASARLADAGAEVIKIERPGGDFARGYDQAAAGQSSYFVWLNRGKQSVVLDLSTREGKAELGRLIEQSDVLIQNLKPGALTKLGFDPEKLQELYPTLITCSISGYGDEGPMANRKAYDLLIQAESGLCSITGGPDEPSRVGISIVDIATGATAHSAILEALIKRGTTGKGGSISISMFDVMADWLTVPLLNHEAGNTPQRIGLAHPSIAPYGAFEPSEGPAILISIQSDREWRSFCTVFLNQPDLADDPTYSTNVARVANRAKTDLIVSEGFGQVASAEAVKLLEQANIAFALVNDMDGLSTHPQLRRITVGIPGGEVSFPAPAAKFEGVERKLGDVPGLEIVDKSN